MNAMPIEDRSKTYLEHSMVIHNFVIKVGNQIKDSLCRVFGDSVQYQWRENNDEVVISDVSIICNMRDRKNVSFTGIPRFVMEVLLDATENYDRNEKMDIYRKVGVSEYWIVDWRKKNFDELFDIEWRDNSTGKGLNIFSPFCFGEQMLDSVEGGKQIQITKGLPQSLKGYDIIGYSLFSCSN